MTNCLSVFVSKIGTAVAPYAFEKAAWYETISFQLGLLALMTLLFLSALWLLVCPGAAALHKGSVGGAGFQPVYLQLEFVGVRFLNQVCNGSGWY